MEQIVPDRMTISSVSERVRAYAVDPNAAEALWKKSEELVSLCHSTDATEFMTQLIAKAETVLSKYWGAVSVARETRDEDEA